MKRLSLAVCMLLSFSLFAHADVEQDFDTSNWEDEFDPHRPDAEAILEMYDRIIEAETGESPFLPDAQMNPLLEEVGGCYRSSCAVWINISRGSQSASLYVNGSLYKSFAVSTGIPGRGTPAFDKHPDGRIYMRYTSTKFPGGDYKGLGNMPYAVFIRGGFAIHGTPKGNWGKLGRKASHGCIRVHPTNGLKFNQLVRQYGVRNTWITVQ